MATYEKYGIEKVGSKKRRWEDFGIDTLKPFKPKKATEAVKLKRRKLINRIGDKVADQYKKHSPAAKKAAIKGAKEALSYFGILEGKPKRKRKGERSKKRK